MISQYESHDMAGDTRSSLETPPAGAMIPESLFLTIWHGRWIVLIATVVALGTAFAYLQKATPIYTSTSRIYVEQNGPKIMSATEEGVMTRSNNYLYTQLELLKSTPIIGAAIDEPGIKQLKIFKLIDNPVGFLKKGLDASVGKKDEIISLSLDSPYPAEAAQVVNAVVDSYITYYASRKRSTAAEVLKILQTEKAKRGDELSEKLKTMMDFKKENVSLGLESKQGNILLERLDRLSAVLTESQLFTVEAKSIFESTKAMVNDPVNLKQFIEAQRAAGVYISTDREMAELAARLDELEIRHSDRLRELTADHPAVAAIEVEIERVKEQIEKADVEFAQAQLAVTEQQYLAAKEKEDQLAKYFEDQRQEVLNLNEQQDKYIMLQTEWEQTKKLCDILDDRIKELNVTEDVGALNISILEVARPADKPTKPEKARVMAMALILGLMLGGGLSLLREMKDQRLRSAEEISTILGVPVLGVVPSMSKKETANTRGQKVYLESTSAVAEAYRTIRTAVFFSAPKGKAKTVVVTSPAPGDGKTTLVSNLAISMAQAGQHVIILDADFRKPVQQVIFEIAKEPGLSNVLVGSDSLESVIKHSPISGLDIITCGDSVPNPSELLNSDAFADLIAELSLRYDRIVIDAPPVMPVTDACILGAICDTTILVLRAEKSTRRSAQQARDGLLSVGAHLLGSVVNDVPNKKGRYGYYGYGYGNTYGVKAKERETQDGQAPAVAATAPKFKSSFGNR